MVGWNALKSGPVKRDSGYSVSVKFFFFRVTTQAALP